MQSAFAQDDAQAAAPATAPPAKKAYSEEAVKHYNKGVELHQSGFLNQAIAEYRGAIESDDRMEEAWSNLGGIYAAQRSYSKATEAFQKALTLKPDRPTTLNGLGTVLYARGKIEDAKKMWRQAIIADPKFASAYYNMANALENEKKTPEAVAEYVKAIEVNPNMGDSFYRIATLYLKELHLAQAKVMFAKAVLLGPDAEYIRDAKKQLSALDSSFAGDVIDRHESTPKTDTTTPGTKDSGTVSTTRQKPETAKNNEQPVARTKQKKEVPVETPATTSTHGIDIRTDDTGRGTVVETPLVTEKTKKKKKEKVRRVRDDVAKNAPAQPATENVTPATVNPPEAATTPTAAPETSPTVTTTPETTPTPMTTPTLDSTPTADTNTSKSEPAPTATSVPETTPAQAAGTNSQASGSDLTGMRDDSPKPKSKKKHGKKVSDDLARTFIVPPQDTTTSTSSDATNADSMTSTTPATTAPAASDSTTTPAPDASTSTAVEAPTEAVPPATKKKKPLFRKHHESADSNTIFKTIDREASDVSDLKEKPTGSPSDTNTGTSTGSPQAAPGDSNSETMQNQ